MLFLNLINFYISSVLHKGPGIDFFLLKTFINQKGPGIDKMKGLAINIYCCIFLMLEFSLHVYL